MKPFVSDLDDSPVEIDLSNLNASDGIKDKIRKEFKHIKDLLDFDKKSHEIFRNWYIDGRIYYNKVIDIKRPQDGIQELRYIDALKMRYVRKEKNKNKDRADLFNKECRRCTKSCLPRTRRLLYLHTKDSLSNNCSFCWWWTERY